MWYDKGDIKICNGGICVIIDSIGYNHSHEAGFVIDRPNGTAGFLFLLIKTPAFFRKDGNDFHIKKNSFILYREEMAQYYGSSGGKYIDDWIHFTYENQEEYDFPERLGIPIGEAVHLREISELSLLICTMVNEHYSSNKFNHRISSSYMDVLMYKLADKLAGLNAHGLPAAPSPHADKLKLLRADIYNFPKKNRSVDSMAQDLSMSRSGFQHTYKKIFGVNVMYDINASRIERAKMLLSSTGLPLREIAEQSGFGSETYFMRRFREMLNMTPTEYRMKKF